MSWAFLTRAGSEIDLIEEFEELGTVAEQIGEGVVLAQARPRKPDGPLIEPAFARQAMRTQADHEPMDPELLADRLAPLLKRRKNQSWALQVCAPDSKDPRDPRRRWIEASAPLLEDALLVRLAPAIRDAMAPAQEADLLLQVWPVDETGTIIGLTEARLALSRAPGGRRRLKRPEEAPSRAGLKLEEAIAWAGVGPEKGERCVDLGAAPGGWTQVAVRRGAHVLAIDPAKMKVELPAKRFSHLLQSAFDYAPEEPLDWLLCDMAWRPLEVCRLLAKWARRGWAQQMIVNIKLPMKRKAKILAQILGELEKAGWRGLKARQLYYDRDEVTLFGWLDPIIARKGAQAPFSLRARKPKTSKKPRGRPRGRKRPRQKSLKRR